MTGHLEPATPGRANMTTADGGALALLPIPPVATLSEQQVCGHVCVWCGAALATGRVVDLGQRQIQRLDCHITMFPRACRACVRVQAEVAVRGHTDTCEMCVIDDALCEEGTILRELMWEYRRPEPRFESYPEAPMAAACRKLTAHAFSCPDCTPTSSCAKGDRLFVKYQAAGRAARGTGKAES
ncbi:hypothetical protein OK074_7636 [Actinobacteria bacterium OK074]|nr:hypothetical protein OK074_7636 [Actinobacteria bacterium OK074]